MWTKNFKGTMKMISKCYNCSINLPLLMIITDTTLDCHLSLILVLLETITRMLIIEWSLLKQFQKNRDLLVEYNNIIQDQLKNGVIEVAPTDVQRCQLKLYFLPHRPVIRLDKITTSVGMVYDARMISI